MLRLNEFRINKNEMTTVNITYVYTFAYIKMLIWNKHKAELRITARATSFASYSMYYGFSCICWDS